jgi:ABC-type hemin transport system substrate-binding protein
MRACCGRRRAVAAAPHRPASTPADKTGAATVNLHYLAQRPVQVRGSITGRIYSFSAEDRVQAIDRRDVVGLLRTGLFRAR